MKKSYLFLVFIGLFLCSVNEALAQLVPPNAFLKGTYLEIGEYQNGGFGVPSGAPAGYHPRGGTGMSAVYDWGHDGWAVGVPTPYMGDYFLPGFSQEGWAIQAAGVPGTAYAPYAMTGGLTGGITGYSSAAGITTVGWSGSFRGLTITQETRVDINASWVVVTTRMTNGTGLSIPDVYYMRTCDPDNAAFWASPTGGYTTQNTIVEQNDLDHRVQVSATDPGYGATSTYCAICTKDCRAKAFYCPGLQPPTNLASNWLGIGVSLSGTNMGDQGIGVVWNLGAIAPGATDIISYAYTFDNVNGIDTALPDPQMVVNGDTIRNAPPTQPTYDTLNTCSLPPGTTIIPVKIIYGTDKDWTISSWTWEPGTGLSTVTGVTNTIDLTALLGPTTYTITGTDSGMLMNDCAHRVFILTILPCHTAFNNGPCEGDTLKLTDKGDSILATYAWSGPLGFTSTMQSPYIFPAILDDSGWYYVIKTVLGHHDTDSTHVTIHPRPDITATSNSPLCANQIDTLHLFVNPASPGDVFNWTGPGGFGSGLQNPTVFGLAPPVISLGVYTVVATTTFGCKDTAYTNVDTISRPLAPMITGPTPYCQYETFVPFTVSGLGAGAVVWWYPSALGLPGTTIPSVVNTAVVGYTTVWASQKIGSCESPRGSFTVRVITTPPAPGVTYTHQYCQYIGPVDTIIATHTATGVLRWYTAAVGGSFTLTQPIPDITRVPAGGSYLYWVSQIDSGCEGLRTPITITIHPKPNPPVVVSQEWCQFRTPGPVAADPSGAGDILTWYGPGVTVGMTTAPTPSTLNAPDTIVYYVTETSPFGCISDSATDRVIIKLKPQPPLVADIKYCQRGGTVPLNGQVDSAHDSHLNWYYNAVPLTPPVYPLGMNPMSDTIPGTYTYYVSQTVPDIDGCESDSAALNVTIIYKPVFGIRASQPYVCQFDSVVLAYDGPGLYAPGYLWTLPAGAYFADRTHRNDSLIIVKFDSATLNNYVTLVATDDSGFCSGDTSIRIRIVPQPVAYSYSRPDLCLGDTTDLALAYQSANAHDYVWYIDSVLMANSLAINIISSNSNSGGPFNVSWIDSGRHVIQITTFTKEGCKSEPALDTINVHTVPDAGFKIVTRGGTLCVEDSVMFVANNQDYKNSFNWAPEHFFNNENTPTIWGRVEQLRSNVMLTVTDPFGCVASERREIDPEPCCMVVFPNAFTPNGDLHNNVFRPICSGYHRFHMFRIVNRWGQTVYETSNSSDAAWDGNYNGVPQDIGTYFYFLKYDCGGKTIEAKGDVTLLR